MSILDPRQVLTASACLLASNKPPQESGPHYGQWIPFPATTRDDVMRRVCAVPPRRSGFLVLYSIRVRVCVHVVALGFEAATAPSPSKSASLSSLFLARSGGCVGSTYWR